jgi:phage recombination protein Bet
MNQPLARVNGNVIAIGEQYGFESDKVTLIKSLIANEATDNELALFLYTAQRTGLDPLAKQIYCIKRKGKMSIQTGIDGYRLIADRTNNYAPGRAATFEYAEDGSVYSATAYVMKYVRGTWHEVSATVYWDEYVVLYEGKPQNLWASKPRVMLSKCAEAVALRRAFPAELSGLYTDTEMGDEAPRQAETVTDEQRYQVTVVESAEHKRLTHELQQARRELATLGGAPDHLTTSTVMAWTPDQIKEEIIYTQEAITKIKDALAVEQQAIPEAVEA